MTLDKVNWLSVLTEIKMKRKNEKPKEVKGNGKLDKGTTERVKLLDKKDIEHKKKSKDKTYCSVVKGIQKLTKKHGSSDFWWACDKYHRLLNLIAKRELELKGLKAKV